MKRARLCICSNGQAQLPSFIQTKRHCHIRGMNGSFLTFLLFFKPLQSITLWLRERQQKKTATSSTTELTKQIKTSLAPAFFFSFFASPWHTARRKVPAPFRPRSFSKINASKRLDKQYSAQRKGPKSVAKSTRPKDWINSKHTGKEPNSVMCASKPSTFHAKTKRGGN